jgi:hypothetical protein
MLPWSNLIASAVGTAGVLIPIYLFGFRQIIESKNALNERLQQEIKTLEKERAATLIQEKLTLVGEIERRAQEKIESDRMIEQMTIEVRHITEQVVSSGGNIESLSARVRQATTEVEGRIKRDQVVGLLAGNQIFLELFLEWRELTNEVPSESLSARFDLRFVETLGSMSALVERVRHREDGLLKVDDIQAKARAAGLAKQMRPAPPSG